MCECCRCPGPLDPPRPPQRHCPLCPVPWLSCATSGWPCSVLGSPACPASQTPSAPSPQGTLSGAHYLTVNGSDSHLSSGPSESVWSPAPIPVNGTRMALIPKMNHFVLIARPFAAWPPALPVTVCWQDGLPGPADHREEEEWGGSPKKEQCAATSQN